MTEGNHGIYDGKVFMQVSQKMTLGILVGSLAFFLKGR